MQQLMILFKSYRTFWETFVRDDRNDCFSKLQTFHSSHWLSQCLLSTFPEYLDAV